MRRLVCITMALSFLFTVTTGFAEAHVHPGRSGVHTPLAIIFLIATLTHVVINHKAFFKHFSTTLKS
jgi:hypothetical protein